MKGNFKLVLGLIFVLAIQLSLALKVSDAQTCPPPDPKTRDSRFITGPEFLNNNSWTTADQILEFLKKPKINSWLQGPKGDGIIEDVDVNRTKINFPEEILKAARDPIGKPGVSPRPINPQLLIAKVQSENGLLLGPVRPPDKILAKIVNCGQTANTIARQIQCAAETLRAGLNGFDSLAACRKDNTWGVDRITQTADGQVNVRPRNAATGAIFGYTGEAGKQWGGTTRVGGTANFCGVWSSRRYLELGVFANPPKTLTLSPTNPTLTCSDPLGPPDRRNVTFSVSGGKPPYTWTAKDPISGADKGTISACGANGEDAVLKPPENPGSGIAGVAYHLAGCSFQFGGDCFNQGGARCFEAQYGCNDQPLAGCGGFTAICLLGCAPQTCDTCKAALAGANYSFDDVLVTVDGRDFFSGKPITTGCVPRTNPGLNVCTDFLQRGIGRVIDKRTQSCKPCRLEMQGATVTVRDAAGVPVSKTVTVK